MADELTLEIAQGIRLGWDSGAVAALTREAPPQRRVWRADRALAPRYDMLRVLSGALADGGLVLVAAARPAAAEGHDADAIAALVVDPDGRPQAIDEVLLSTQYDRDGAVRRVGLELYPPDADFPLRAAGDSERTGAYDEGQDRTDWAALALRFDGRSGTALFEVVRTP